MNIFTDFLRQELPCLSSRIKELNEAAGEMVMSGMTAYGWTRGEVMNTDSRLRHALVLHCPKTCGETSASSSLSPHPYTTPTMTTMTATETTTTLPITTIPTPETFGPFHEPICYDEDMRLHLDDLDMIHNVSCCTQQSGWVGEEGMDDSSPVPHGIPPASFMESVMHGSDPDVPPLPQLSWEPGWAGYLVTPAEAQAYLSWPTLDQEGHFDSMIA